MGKRKHIDSHTLATLALSQIWQLCTTPGTHQIDRQTLTWGHQVIPSCEFTQGQTQSHSSAQFVLKPSGRQTLIWPSNHTFMPIHARLQCRKNNHNKWKANISCCQRHYLSPRSCLAGGKQYNIGQSSSTFFFSLPPTLRHQKAGNC